jgi:TRAP-type C4-dicarboxylate transport system permease small subunit
MAASRFRGLDLANRALRALELLAMGVTAAGLFTIMAVIVADVAARYFFRSPLPWSFDLISLYLTPAIFFLALSDTLQREHHVNVDIVFGLVGPRVAHALRFAGSALAIVVFLGVTWVAAIHAWEAYRSSAVTSGIIQWPTWVSSAFVVAGAGLLLLRLVFRTVAFGIAAVTGATQVPGIAAPGHPEEDL